MCALSLFATAAVRVERLLREKCQSVSAIRIALIAARRPVQQFQLTERTHMEDP